MNFHKVIFKPITTAQRNLHFNDLYVHFWTPLSSHIQIPKIPPKKYAQNSTFTIWFFWASSGAYYFFYFYLLPANLDCSPRWEEQIFYISTQFRVSGAQSW